MQAVQELQAHEIDQVGGGIALLAPLAIALMDTGGWSALAIAAGGGFSLGNLMLGMGGGNGEDLTNYALF